jgi:hypothetical protein
LDVLRNALVTHGHPHGFCGAVFHALVLSETISNGKLPTVEASAKVADCFVELLDIISAEPQLAAFWRSAWENSARTSLNDALKTARNELLRDIDKLLSIGRSSPPGAYHALVSEGVPTTAMWIAGRGSTELLTSTGNRVREPRNRRVMIVAH